MRFFIRAFYWYFFTHLFFYCTNFYIFRIFVVIFFIGINNVIWGGGGSKILYINDFYFLSYQKNSKKESKKYEIIFPKILSRGSNRAIGYSGTLLFYQIFKIPTLNILTANYDFFLNRTNFKYFNRISTINFVFTKNKCTDPQNRWRHKDVCSTEPQNDDIFF